MTSLAYSPSEMMVVAAARALVGVRAVFVGVGLPNVACYLARLTVAPELQLIYESGIYGARPARKPLSIGDPALVSGAASVIPMADLFNFYLQGGLVEVALLGGAQVDRHGNLNTTVIGDYVAPKVRLPGSGGACEIAINAGRVLYIMRLTRRSFVGQLDFVTSPGYLGGGDDRQQHGMPGGGPQLVITDKALFDFNNERREMQLVSLHPGAALDEVRALVGWELRVSPALSETPAPTEDDLRLLREVVDAEGQDGR